MSDSVPSGRRSEKEIFFEALEKPTPQERAAFLDGACGTHPEQRAKVEALLANHFQQDDFMKDPAVEPSAPTVTAPLPAAAPAQMLGRYKLLEKIGEGGFGEVWMAEQREPVKRRVALKIIKLGMDSRQIVARFEAERQALAMMDHPNIAKIFDAGTTESSAGCQPAVSPTASRRGVASAEIADGSERAQAGSNAIQQTGSLRYESEIRAGRPYFVMELVRGIKITEYCDQNQLTTRQRLDLFIKVCQAIQHAHQKGIIHRDIKPSNILVTLHDGVPVPKVIDFGIAKATQQELTDKTVFTQFQQFIGTPAYISPEQAEMSGLDIDTRADIYSLGVLLYELLVGQTPFDAKEMMKGGIDALRQIIREREPLRPSTRLNTLPGDARTTAGKRRQTDAGKLKHQLQGDLDWIVMKCLEKDRARRYDTANGLAADIQRHLADEPVVARPPSTTYRLQKIVRRNKVAFAGIAAVAAVLVLGAIVSSWQAVRAIQAEKQAEQKAEAEVRARKSEAQQRGLAEGALAQARIEEGKAWLERAQSYLEERNPFCAKLMAGRAIGFRGFGREKLTEAQREDFLELLPPESAEAREADIMLRGTDDYAPIWHGPVATNHDGTLSRTDGFAFSPDGRLLASANGSTSIGLWDVATGIRKAALQGHSNRVMCVTFSPEGRLLVSASQDRTIRLWDITTQTTLAVLDGYSAEVQVVAFSPNGRLLAACGESRTIRFWEMPSGVPLPPLVEESIGDSWYWSLAFSPDGTLLAAGCEDGTVELWQETTRQKKEWKGHTGAIPALAFSPDGRFLATAGFDTTIKLWKMPSGELIKELHGQGTEVASVQFSPDGGVLASQNNIGVIRLWVVPHGGLKATLRPSMPRGNWGAAAFSPDGSLLGAGGTMVQIWELASTHIEIELTGHSGMVRGLAVSRDGTLLASGSDDKTVALWDLASGYFKPEFLKHPERVWGLALSPDGRRVASGCADGIVRFWEVATGRLETELRGHNDSVRVVAFSADGTLLASGDYRGDSSARLWDVSRRKPRDAVSVLSHGGMLVDLAFDPQGRWLATAGDGPGDCIMLWDVATGKTHAPALKPRGRFLCVKFSPDGHWLAAGEGYSRGMIDLWDVESRQLKAEWPGHSDEIIGLDFSPDGRLLASASLDHTIALWDVATAQLLGRLTGHSAAVSTVVFTRDGRRLISCSDDTSIRIWDVKAALNRPLNYAGFLNGFELEGRNVTWKALGGGSQRRAGTALPYQLGDMPMKSFTSKSLIAVLQSGLSEDELDRILFRRFLRAGNLSSARVILERHAQPNWTGESEVLGRAYLREAKTVLDYQGYRLAAQHAARAQTFLSEIAAQAWHVTALAERGLKRWPESLAAIEQAIALEANDAEFWHDKATILEAQNQKSAAREALARAIELARKTDEKDRRLESWRQQLELLKP